MNLGILGYGSMGKAHAYAVSALPYYYDPLPFRARVKGVCCAHYEKAQKVAEQCGFERAYADLNEMLSDPELDAISICTPNLLHYEQILACIEAGKAIYCEKPLCITPAQAWHVARLAEEKGTVAHVVFQNRHLAAVRKAKALIEQGALGRILTFRFAYLHASCTEPGRKAGWKQNKDVCGGGVLFDLGSHVLDLATFLCGEAAGISGLSQIGYPTRLGMDGEVWETNADEAFYMTLRMKNGACGQIEASKLAKGTMDELSFSIHGERGAIRFDLMDPHHLQVYSDDMPEAERGFVRIPCGGRYEAPGGGFPSYKAASGWLRGHVASMYAFLHAVHTGSAGDPTFAQGAYVQSLMELAMQSDACGSVMLSVPNETEAIP